VNPGPITPIHAALTRRVWKVGVLQAFQATEDTDGANPGEFAKVSGRLQTLHVSEVVDLVTPPERNTSA
jgi:hypothetical protein